MSRSFSFLIAGLCCWSAAANCFAQAPAKASPSQTAAPEPSATPTTRALIDSMDAADLKEAIQLLKNNYIKPDALNETELSRAAFEGILTRLGRGVILLPNASADSGEAATPFYSEILDGHVGYLRLGVLNKANLDSLDTNLQNFATKKVDAVVLDFRASPATNDFAVAAAFAKRFCPKDKTLFTLRKPTASQECTFTSDRDPAYQGLIVVLADGDTAGAAGAGGGGGHIYDKAVGIRETGRGRAGGDSEFKLPSGKLTPVA